jgi:6-phosphogluconate dehydrogenase/gluconokinase
MTNYIYIVILVGVCGTGKSLVGKKVAQRLGVPFFDADTMSTSVGQSQENLPQDGHMEAWLTVLADCIAQQLSDKGCVISCSVLKREHRKRLTAKVDHEIDWVFMKDSYENAVQRVGLGGGQTRSVSQLQSDFDNLEAPRRALTITMNSTEQEMIDTILKYMARKYA